MSGSNTFRRIADDRGYVLAVGALLLIPLLAFTGLAVDLGGWYARAAHLQRASDAAALAGVAALPRGFDAAEAAALEVAAQNGYVDDGDLIRVEVDQVGADRVRVRITDRTVPLYFTSIFRDEVSVSRASTAEYIPPVRMGSPRNFLGTQRLSDSQRGFTMLTPEGFFLSINSRCALTEDGDLRATRRAGQYGTSDYCSNSAGEPNPTYNENGYIYGVRVEEGYSGDPIQIEIFDAAACPSGNPPTAGWHDAPRLATSLFETTFRLRAPASNPYNGAVLASLTVDGSRDNDSSSGDCSSGLSGYRNRWVRLGVINNPEPGQIYAIQVTSSDNIGNSTERARRGNLNNFALRARIGTTSNPNSAFTPCSADPHETDPNLTTVAAHNCPNLFAMEHMSIFANAANQDAQFYLASIGPEHSNKTLVIDLFDPGEGGHEIRLVNPLGQYETNFTRRVMCRRCNPLETAPADGWDPVVESVVSIAGEGPAPGGGRLSEWRFNERQLRLEVRLPDIAEAYGGATWWRIEYRFGSGTVTDRTTWSVQVRGDPVRLVE